MFIDILCNLLNILDIGDVDAHMPGLLKVWLLWLILTILTLKAFSTSYLCIWTQATHEWFKIYKVPAGKPENTFAFDGQAKDKVCAVKMFTWSNVVNSLNQGVPCMFVDVHCSG